MKKRSPKKVGLLGAGGSGDGDSKQRVTRSSVRLLASKSEASKPCSSEPLGTAGASPVVPKKVNMNPRVVLVDTLKIKTEKIEEKDIVIQADVKEPETETPVISGEAPNPLPQSTVTVTGYTYPLLKILGPLPLEVLDTAKDFRPVGSLKRLQAVIEMVYLDEEEDFELSLDQLEKGVSYFSYSDTTKLKAKERTNIKDPNESFKLDKEIADVKLQELTKFEIKTEDEDEVEDTSICIMDDSVEQDQIASNMDAIDAPSLHDNINDCVVKEDECGASHEANEFETTVEIPLSAVKSENERTGQLHVIPIMIGQPCAGPLNLVPKMSKFMLPRSYNPFLKDKKQWEKPQLSDITPGAPAHAKRPLKSLTKFNYITQNHVSRPFNLRVPTKQDPNSETEDL